MKKIVLGTCVLAAGLVTVAQAREFRPMGYESIAMGGAGVASAKGAMAAYYNPALLGRDTSKTEIATTAGIGEREHNLADNLDSLNEARFTDALARVAANAALVSSPNTAADRQSLINSQRILASMAGGNNGFSVMPDVAVGFQMQRIGFGVYGISDGTATAIGCRLIWRCNGRTGKVRWMVSPSPGMHGPKFRLFPAGSFGLLATLFVVVVVKARFKCPVVS